MSSDTSNSTNRSPSARPNPKFIRLCGAIILALCSIIIVNEAVFAWAMKSLRNDEVASKNEETMVERVADNKPIMYTFYDPVGEKGCCGMTKEGHENLVASWKKAWEDKGWDARVLTGDDAKKNNYFNQIDTKLALLGVSEYNRRCFWRWLAVVQVGGGWMSDYDTFPLELTAEVGMELSVSGKFKSFGRQVPCLIHASADEWERILHDMIRMLPRPKNIAHPNGKRDGKMLSDMYTLENLGKSGIAGELWDFEDLFFYVAPHYSYQRFVDEGKLAIDCEKYRGKLVVHLSHDAHVDAIQKRTYPIKEVHTLDEALERRSESALVLVDDFEKECMQQVVIDH